MESVLLEKMRSGTADDIDKMMIVSRVQKAVMEVYKASSEYANKLDELRGKYEDEIKMSGMSIVVMVRDDTVSEGKPVLECVVGSHDNVEESLKLLEKAIS